MKKEITPEVKEPTFKGLIYGLEDDGIILDGLCAPMSQMDSIGGVFQFTADAYYNPWPSEGENKWKMVKHGVHTTSDITIAAAALSKEDTLCRITNRCVDAFLLAGYDVQLLRRKLSEHTVTTETKLRFFRGKSTSDFPALVSQYTFINGKES